MNPARVPAPWAGNVGEAAWDAATRIILAAIRDRERIVLACHADPDGDALGSMLALHLHLRRRGADSTASWGSEPFRIPPQYTFLPGLETLTPPEQIAEAPDLLITLDSGSLPRLGSLRWLADTGATMLVIDHHATNTGFGDHRLVAPDAAATAVIVEELILRLGGRIDRDLAACLYVGLVTDTGRFQYANTDRAAMEMGSRLLDAGIDQDQMSRQIYDSHSFGYLKLMARVLDRATFVPEASLVYSWLTQDDLDRLGVAIEETESVIDVLRTVQSAEVSMIAKESFAREWKVSLRSKGEVDVGHLADRLGGGGHGFSAGFVGVGSIDDIADSVAAVLTETSTREAAH